MTIAQIQALVTLYYSLKSQRKVKLALFSRVRNYADTSKASELTVELIEINEQLIGLEKMPEVMAKIGKVPSWL
jgi:DNA-binding transcriptional regulator WhiA